MLSCSEKTRAMKDTMTTTKATNTASAHQRALKILAKSVYRELKSSGYERRDMIAFTTELLDLVTNELKADADATENAA